MSERYSRLFSLPENLYSVGSPVVIAAGTLLKDNQTGNIVAQLKLRSISNKAIKAVKVSLNLFDTAGNPISNVVEYEYLDLDVSRDAEFGQKNPVFVAESKARSYEVAVTEVVFSDRSVWSANVEVWEPLSRPVPLKISDPELLKQYKIRFGYRSTYEPKEERDLWYCTCGELNRTGEGCHCGNSLFELQTVDMEALNREKTERLVEEARQAEEEKAAAEAVKSKREKTLKIALPVICAVIAFVILLNTVIIPNSKYENAVSLMEAGQYEEAIAVFEAMDGYKDSAAQIVNCNNAIAEIEHTRIEERKAATYAESEALADNGETAKAAIAFWNLGDYQDAKDRSLRLWSSVNEQNRKSTFGAGFCHSVAIQTDGTLLHIGSNKYGQCDISDWNNITNIYSGGFHTIGLTESGTCIAVGSNVDGQCDVSEWKDIIFVSGGWMHTVGLKNNGTVVATGSNVNGECNTSSWRNIISVSAGDDHTAALKEDGTVVATGRNEEGQCKVSDWENIVAVSAGGKHTVALKADGTVVAAGSNKEGQCRVSDWTDIIAIATGYKHTVGLKSDGTVVAVGSVGEGSGDGRLAVSMWKDIIAIKVTNGQTFGLKADGSVVATGYNEQGQCNVSSWKIKIPD